MRTFRIYAICTLLSLTAFGTVSAEGSFDTLEETQQTTLGVLFDYSQSKIDNLPISIYVSRQDRDWNILSKSLENRFLTAANEEIDQCKLISYENDGFTFFVKVSFFSIDEDGECAIAIRLFDKNNPDEILDIIELDADSQRGDWDEALEDSFKDLGEEFGKFLDKKVF